jgi:AcrR family transcriptional regulator
MLKMVSRHHQPETSAGTRETILDAAEALLAEAGYQHMTIDEVAKRAKLGKGTIYLYFESKQDLALSIVDRVNLRLRERLRAILRSGGSPERRLRQMLKERVMYRFDSVKHFQHGVDQILGCLRPMLLERRKTYVDLEAAIFMEVLVEGRTLGGFYCEDPLLTAQVLLTATASLLPYSLSPQELGSRKTLESRIEHLTEFLLRSLKAPELTNIR